MGSVVTVALLSVLVLGSQVKIGDVLVAGDHSPELGRTLGVLGLSRTDCHDLLGTPVRASKEAWYYNRTEIQFDSSRSVLVELTGDSTQTVFDPVDRLKLGHVSPKNLVGVWFPDPAATWYPEWSSRDGEQRKRDSIELSEAESSGRSRIYERIQKTDAYRFFVQIKSGPSSVLCLELAMPGHMAFIAKKRFDPETSKYSTNFERTKLFERLAYGSIVIRIAHLKEQLLVDPKDSKHLPRSSDWPKLNSFDAKFRQVWLAGWEKLARTN